MTNSTSRWLTALLQTVTCPLATTKYPSTVSTCARLRRTLHAARCSIYIYLLKKWIAITSVVEEGVLKKRVLLRKVWCVRSACVVLPRSSDTVSAFHRLLGGRRWTTEARSAALWRCKAIPERHEGSRGVIARERRKLRHLF